MTAIPTRPEAALIERRAEFEDAMARHFAGRGQVPPPAEDERAARHLTGLLVAATDGSDAGPASAAPIATIASYYGRFGDALRPILKDVLGADATPIFLAKAIDGYWQSVRDRLARHEAHPKEAA